MMQAIRPHYLLYCESLNMNNDSRWRFVLRPVGCDELFAASDSEPTTCLNRLELLAVVRGLEALDQPSRVLLVTRSGMVRRGICHLLNPSANSCRFLGKTENSAARRDHDLWQRVKRALEFHQVECRAWRPGEVPTAESVMASSYPRLLHNRRRAPHQPRRWSLAGAFSWIRQSILSQIADVGQPPFTRAA